MSAQQAEAAARVEADLAKKKQQEEKTPKATNGEGEFELWAPAALPQPCLVPSYTNPPTAPATAARSQGQLAESKDAQGLRKAWQEATQPQRWRPYGYV